MNVTFKLAAAAVAAAALTTTAFANPLDKTECIAPAKPGGGFDLTCKLVQSALVEGKYIADPMRVTYMPGGIGAVAYNTVVAQRQAIQQACAVDAVRGIEMLMAVDCNTWGAGSNHVHLAGYDTGLTTTRV